LTGSAKKQPLPFGKYLLLDRINIGGMAEVWRGKAFGTGGFERLVAIKRILPNIAEDDEFVAMFIDEAKISVQLSHANVGQIYDLGQECGTYFIAMEYIAGKDLRAVFDRCRKRSEPAPAPVALTCHVIARVCEGLDYAHKKRDAAGEPMHIVHRDVSPQNVLLSFDGDVKVIDFGIAKAAGKATRTQAGILKGKFGYMSPEQVRGAEIDRRADIFAIGICLFELLTGERLFVGETDFAVLEKVRNAVVPSPSELNPKVPPELEQIVRKALAQDLEERYQYASELADDLHRFVEEAKLAYTARELGQFMRGIFADEVEREAQRLKDYAEILPPEGFVEAASRPAMPRRSSLQIPSAAAVPRAPTPQPSPVPLPAPGAGASQEFGADDVEDTDGSTLLIGPGVVSAALGPLLPPVGPDEVTSTQTGAASLVPGIPVLVPIPIGDDPPTTPGRRLGTSGPRTALPPASALPVSPLPGAAAPGSAGPEGGLVLPPDPLPSESGPQEDGTPTFGTVGGDFGDSGEPLTDSDRTGPVPASLAARSGEGPWPIAPRPPAPRRSRASNPRLPKGAPRKGRRSQAPLWAVGVAALLLVGAVAGVWGSREPATGYVMIDVPEEARTLAKLNLNGTPLPGPLTWPVLRRLPVGRAMVMVSAEGFKPFVQPVDVVASDQPTAVQANLVALKQLAKLLVETEPADAEIQVDGKVVRAQGQTGFQPTSIPVGTAVTLTVSAKGFQARTEQVSARKVDEVVIRKVALEVAKVALEVSSMPAGAEVLLGGRALGTTPATLRVPVDTRTVTLRKRCYAPAVLSVTPPAVPGAAVTLHATLERKRGCR